MITAVFDTNILISSFLSRGAPYQALGSVVDGNVSLMISPEMIKEFKEVIGRDKFGFSKELIEQMVMMVIDISEMVEPDIKLDVIKEDPEDNKVLECAICSKADYIVTGDPHLLRLKKFRGVQIINVNYFMDRL